MQYSILCSMMTLAISGCFKLPPTQDQEPDLITIMGIHETADVFGLKPLGDKNIGKGNFEIRIWLQDGWQPMRCYIINYTSGEWQGRLYPSDRYPSKLFYLEPGCSDANEPTHSWDDIWSRLVSHDIMKLPDMRALPRKKSNIAHLDGSSMVVELKEHNKYRNYHYLLSLSLSDYDYSDGEIFYSFNSAINIAAILRVCLKTKKEGETGYGKDD